MLVSSGDFSFLLTLSSLLSMFSFLMVALKMETNRSCKGVSMKMMEWPGMKLIAVQWITGHG